MKTRILSICLTLLMTMLTQITWAESTITYTTSDGQPLKLKYPDAFGTTIIENKYENGVGTITFDGDIRTIPEAAFSYCITLTSIEIPDVVYSIIREAFIGCSSLTSVKTPDYLMIIGDNAFCGCTSLSSITLSSNIISIGSNAFEGCAFARDSFVNKSNYTDGYPWGATLADEVTADGLIINNNIVTGYTGASADVKIPEGVTAFESYVFRFSGLVSIEIPSTVTNIEDDSFDECYSLSTVVLHEGVTSIGSSVFFACSGLSSVTLPSTLTSIGEHAFYYCTSLTSIEIPEGVTSIGEDAFKGCTFTRANFVNKSNLTDPDNWGAKVIDEITADGLIISDGVVIGYEGESTTVTIPEGITGIGKEAFSGQSITSVTLPSTLTSIGGSAFARCSSLTSIEIPSSVTSIGEWAFGSCIFMRANFVNKSNCTDPDNWGALVADEITADGLIISDHIVIKYTGNGSSVTIPEGVTGISKEVFYYRRSLTTIVIPSTVTSIGEGAFYGCSFMKENFVNNSNCRDHNYWGAEVKQITSDGLTIRNDAVTQYTGNGGSVIIPEGVYAIDSRVFRWKGLTSVVIPSTITIIGGDAFEGCTFMKEDFVNNSNYTDGYPWGAKIIDEITADGLVITNHVIIEYRGNGGSVTIPEGVTGINEYVFSWMGLTSVVIPSTVTSIGEYAFYGCTFMKENFVNNSNYTDGYPWGARIADEITADGLVISNNVVVDYVGNDGVSVTIPEGIVGIGADAFSSRELASVVIPSTVTSIDSWAFAYCSISRMSVGENPPAITSSTFYWMNTSSCILYVPAGCADAYRNADYWKYFTNIQEENYDINHDGNVDMSDVTKIINYILKQEEKK